MVYEAFVEYNGTVGECLVVLVPPRTFDRVLRKTIAVDAEAVAATTELARIPVAQHGASVISSGLSV